MFSTVLRNQTGPTQRSQTYPVDLSITNSNCSIDQVAYYVDDDPTQLQVCQLHLRTFIIGKFLTRFFPFRSFSPQCGYCTVRIYKT